MGKNGVKVLDDKQLKKLAKENKTTVSNICCICGKVIEVQIFKNSGVCSEMHRKDRDNDHLPFRGGSLAP